MEKKVTHYPADHLLRQVIDAIDAGDLELAKKNAEFMFNGAKTYHDGVLDMFSLALNYIAEREGEDGIGNVWRYIGENIWGGLWGAIKGGYLSIEQYSQKICTGEMAHYSDFSIEEDDEKIVCVMHDCGVCGRMCKEGKLDTANKKGAFKLGTIKEPHDWTQGYAGMPYYCIHAPYLFNILGQENGIDFLEWQWGKMLDEDGNLIDEPCKEIIYKKPRNT